MTNARERFINETNARWWTLGAMCFALFMVMLDNTVVNVALPSIQRDFGTTVSSLEWTINAYTLAFGVILATGGRLGDIFGRRRMFLFGVVVFAAASAACGAAPSATALTLARVAQGFGAAFMMPGTLSIITDAFPPQERGKAIGTWAGVSALALAVGPVLGGFLTEHVTWRAIFYINLPVAAGAVLATLFAVRESRDETVGREVDYLGVIALTVSLTALILALIEGNDWGWGSASTVGLLATFVVMAVLFVVIENRVKAPMVEFDFFRSRDFLGATLVAFVISVAMLGTFFFLALYMQNILGYSPLEAGVRFLPTTLMIVALAPIAGRLSDRIGPRPLIITGLSILVVSLFLQTNLDVDTSYGDLFLAFMIMGVGIALTMSPMSTAAMNAVDKTKAGLASGLLSMSRMIGGSFGIAAIGAIFQARFDDHLGQLLGPGSGRIAETAQEHGFGAGSLPPGISAAQAERVGDALRESFVTALNGALRLSVVMVILGTVGAALLLHPKGAEDRVPDDAVSSAAATPAAEPAIAASDT